VIALLWIGLAVVLWYFVKVSLLEGFDEHCEYCWRGINTKRQRFIAVPYSAHMGFVTGYDEWLVCSPECEAMQLQTLVRVADNV
jgi:hypothetical protein